MKNIITISREYGSGGYEIGQKVAEALGYKFYDKELIAELADKLMVSEKYIEHQENQIVRKNIFREIGPLFAEAGGADTDFIFEEQGKFIEKLAEAGNCVIAGRRADYYLRNNPNALHLFFYADEEFKAERIMEAEKCKRDVAIKKLQDMDKRRKTSYEYTTGRKWADRHNYDRMICTSSLGVDKCVDEIVNLIKLSQD